MDELSPQDLENELALEGYGIDLAGRHEFAFGLLQEVVVLDRKPGILRTIRQGLEYDGLPPDFYSRLRQYLHTL